MPPIGSVMYVAVAVWAQRNDKVRIIWTAIAQSSDVMGFKIWCAVRTVEGSRLQTALTLPFCASNHVFRDNTATLKNTALPAFFTGSFIDRSKGPIAQLHDIFFMLWYIYIQILERFYWQKLEHNGFAHIFFSIGRDFAMEARANHLTLKTQPLLDFAEKQQALTVFTVVGNSFIAAQKFHIIFLALAKIFKSSIVAQSIGIAMRQASFACNENYHRVLRWSNNTALLLASKLLMNISTPAVNTPTFKSPHHLLPASGKARQGIKEATARRGGQGIQKEVRL